MAWLSIGKNTLPISILIRLNAFCINIIAFSVVSLLALNSASMLPAYFEESPTLLKLACKASKLESRGDIAPIDSVPNKSLSTAACFSLGKAFKAVNTSSIAPLASTCIFLAISAASSPNVWKAAACVLVAPSPAVMPRMRFFMPVAATSDCTPVPTIEAPRAAISPDATPPTSPRGPILVTTSEINGADAAVVLPK